MRQIALPLDWPDNDTSGFIVDESNSEAVRHLENWTLWPVPITLLTGPRKSGRSTLARLFSKQVQSRILDDADLGEEEALFHAWNRAQFEREPLLIVADEPPPRWHIDLPDLRTRMAATPKVAIREPSDALIDARIQHYFARRGMNVAPNAIEYLLKRIERSHYALFRLIESMERIANERRSGVTRGVAREAIGEVDNEQAG